MDLEQKTAHGIRAAEVLQSAVYIEAYELIKTELTTQWQQSPARDAEGREKLWLMLTMLAKVQATMERAIETGKLAQHQLGHQRTQQEKRAEYLGL